MLLKIRKLAKNRTEPRRQSADFMAKDSILEFEREWKGKAVKLKRRKTREIDRRIFQPQIAKSDSKPIRATARSVRAP
jgi:hypothetical protein